MWPPACAAACMPFGLALAHANDVPRRTHLPRMLPPIIKCVALSERWLSARNEYSVGDEAVGPSSNDSCGLLVGLCSNNPTHGQNAFGRVDKIVRRLALVRERTNMVVPALLASGVGRVPVVRLRGLDVGHLDRRELVRPCFRKR